MCLASQHPTFQVLGAKRVLDPELEGLNPPIVCMLEVFQAVRTAASPRPFALAAPDVLAIQQAKNEKRRRRFMQAG